MNGDTFKFTMIGDDQLTRPLKQAQNTMKNLARETNNAKRQMTIFGNSVKDVRKFNLGALQQAGYQFGDYAVQVANGTNKMQAFGQQAPQFLQIFGPFGAIIGAVVAGLAAFGVAAQKSAEAAEKAAGKAKTYKEQMQMLEASIRALSDAQLVNSGNIDTIRKKYGAMTEDLREFLKIQRELALIETMQQTTNAFEKLINTKDYQKVVGELGAIKDDVLDAERALAQAVEEKFDADQIKAFQENLEASEQQFAALNRQLENMPEGKLMAISEEFLDAAESKNFDGMKAAIVSMREQIVELPAISRQALLPMVVQMEGQMRALSVAMDGGFKEVEKAALSTVDAAFMLASGALPPQAAADLIKHKDLYDLIRKAARKAADEAEGLGKTTLSVIQAKFMADKGILPPQAMEDFVTVNKEIEKFYDNLRNRRRKEADEAAAEAEKLAKLADPLGDLQARTKLNTDLLHVSDARRQVMEAIFQSERNYTPQQIEDTIKQIDAYNKQVKEMERIKSTADMIGSAFENAFMSMIDGTKSAKDAFKDLTRSIIADLYRQYVVKQITGFITQSVGAMMAGPVQGPNLPTMDGGGYTGNGARAGGMDGKGGFMAMLHPRETVVDHTKGQGAGGVTVVQNINVSTGVQQTVRTEIKSLMPQIAESAKAAVADAKRRGGSYGKAFA